MRYSSYIKVFVISLVVLTNFLVCDLKAQVVINEIMANNKVTIADPDNGKYGDWIELYNMGNTSVDLTGYGLSDKRDVLNKWIFRNGTVIPGNAFMLVWADNDDFGLHTNFRLSSSGETIILSDAALLVLDSVAFTEQIQDVSFGRLNDGGSEWAYFSNPSPGSTNSGGSTELVSAPTIFSLESGFYEGNQFLTLTSQSANSKIYYTLNGADPSQTSSIYQEPIAINQSTVIRCIQLETGYLPSPIVTKTIFIDENTTLPVFSITTDPENLWSKETGIYNEGNDYVWGWNLGNFWQNWEKPCYVEFWEANRKKKISQAAGLKINGALTRTASQKSLRIIAKSIYGKTKFSYKFFKDKDISSYNELVLRSSGNDWANTMMADGMMASIVARQMDIDYTCYRPAILFLNGEYWGIHNIREKVGGDYIEENHGYDKDNVDLLSQIDDLREGDRVNYTELLNFVKNNSMADIENYSYVQTKLDIKEYINYYISQIFYSNIDWPAGNIKYWRSRDEYSKWRWIIFDTDLAFQKVNHNTMTWASDPAYHIAGVTDLFSGLMDSDKFKEEFLNTFQYHMATTFSSKRVISIIDSLQLAIEPEIDRHIERWYGQHGWTYTTSNGIYLETPWLESYETWQDNIEEFRNFARNRASFLNSHVSSFFAYGKPIELSLNIDPPGAGRIWINEEKGTPDPINMLVFENQTINFQTLNNLDTDFQYWIEQSGVYNDGDQIQIIPKSSEWKFLDSGDYPGTNWMNKNFDDSAWPEGPGPLGYNDLNVQTIVDFGGDPANKHITYWFRKSFEYSLSVNWKSLMVKVLRDDGAIVYLNGQEIARTNMPDDSNYNTFALDGTDGKDETTYFDFPIPNQYLVRGINTIAVEVHQFSTTSSDLIFDLGLAGVTGATDGESITHQDLSLSKNFTEKTILTAVFEPLSQSLHLSINEIMTSNSGAYLTETGKSPDWVEIYNPNDKIVDVGGLYITDNLLNPDKWRIPSNEPKITSIQPKGFLLLLADQRYTLGPEHLGLQFSAQGEEVGLFQRKQNEFVLIDSMFFPAIPANTSFGRYGDGEDEWRNFVASITPGGPNKDIEDIIPDVPLYLFQNFPSPFSISTKVRFNLKDSAPIRLIVRDMNGKLVKVLTDRIYDSGLITIDWDGTNEQNRLVPPGMYFYTIYSNFYSDTYRTIKLNY